MLFLLCYCYYLDLVEKCGPAVEVLSFKLYLIHYGFCGNAFIALTWFLIAYVPLVELKE
jgi:hypothetical protein